MKKIGNVCLFLGLLTCLYYYAAVEAMSCITVGAGYCNNNRQNFLRCFITSNDTELIKVMLKNCSSENGKYENLYIYKSYVSTKFGNLILDLELPSNIRQVFLFNIRDQDHFRLTTSSLNSGLTRLFCRNNVEIESHNFFNYYTGLQNLFVFNLISKTTPSFTNLQFLTFLYARVSGPGSHTFDNTIVSGLTNLSVLYMVSSYFNGITEDAFDNLIMLRYLNLDSNKIRFIEDGAFTGLSNLQLLSLANNRIKLVSKNIFVGLNQLTYLSISENREFPIEALLHTKSVVQLYIQFNDYHTLDSIIFQQMNALSTVYLDNPFVCDCNLAWASRVSQYGIDIFSGECFEPHNVFHEDITNPQLYVNCTQSESLQCFDKSIACPIHQICHNTEEGYYCDCPMGYELNAIAQCGDIDECDEINNCTQTCENTDGSFYCVCDKGYKLSTNGYDCDDVNECQEWNGGCEFGCRNTIGSFQCYCDYGHQLMNETHCESDVLCDVVDSRGYRENLFTCQGGFNLTLTNLICQSTPVPTTQTTERPTSCPIGYSLHNSGECKDVDECVEAICVYTCENTEGSYRCMCEEGYKLATNGYDCDDVNECQIWNGGCQFGCRNTIGSFECYCEYGHKLINETHCEEGIECELVGDSCINALESKYYCQGGFNLSIYNLSCPNVDIQGTNPYMPVQTGSHWVIPTVFLLVISLIANAFLIFMLITVFIYFVRKDNKVQGFLTEEEIEQPQIYRNDNSKESPYNYGEGATNLYEVKDPSGAEFEPKEKKFSSYLAEGYPGIVPDEIAKHQIN
ncbi:hypothetical protein LOD99_8681 [Oopsacas minuta]|uniref:EGF-like domain-containing protein n=1 Tax=Oopsacas minuta TaxID=111878 RepID=A0AAV7JFP3_9METZ|nr:hypothetical protein LOD99_8681 [Oopsacas minuta]